MTEGQTKEHRMAKSRIGGALGLITLIVTKVMSAVKEHGEDIVLGLGEAKLGPVIDRFVADLVAVGRAASNILPINTGGNRTTEQVVAAGKYQYANAWINSTNFPWRRRQGKRTIELVDMAQHGFKSTYSLQDALTVLQKLGLDRPVYEDGLLVGAEYPQKQVERAIMFPHEPVLDADGNALVVYLWCNSGDRKLDLVWASRSWDVGALVAGVSQVVAL